MTEKFYDHALIAVDDLIPYAMNSRTHSDAQVAQIAASIREFGFTNPVLIDEANNLIAGHGRVLAARKLKMEVVPAIVVTGLDENRRRALVIADNQLALNAEWDEEKLVAELQSMSVDMQKLTGFSEEDLLAMLKPAEIEGLTDEDAAPEPPADPVSRLGDVWLLGRHRLVCGDCTDADAVERALQGRIADICLTDPPYGLDEKKKSGKNDYGVYKDTLENLISLASGWLPIAREKSAAVVFSPGVTRQWIYPEPNWVICWFYGGGQLRSPWGFNCWQPFLCYGKDPSLKLGKGARPDAVNLNVPANIDIDHPCPKPVKLWQWFLDRLIFSPNAVIYEPFSGSGTTIIAAEQNGLAVAAIELDPAYVDVAVKRWQDFTGETAILEGDGRTFDDCELIARPN